MRDFEEKMRSRPPCSKRSAVAVSKGTESLSSDVAIKENRSLLPRKTVVRAAINSLFCSTESQKRFIPPPDRVDRKDKMAVRE